MQEMRVQSLGRKDPLEKEMVAHSSILAWEIPWTEETGGLQSIGSQRVGHDWAIEQQPLIYLQQLSTFCQYYFIYPPTSHLFFLEQQTLHYFTTKYVPLKTKEFLTYNQNVYHICQKISYSILSLNSQGICQFPWLSKNFKLPCSN